VEGILYANTVDGATTTLDFLEFFGEASNNFLPSGEPVLRYGDRILLDNHALITMKGDMLWDGGWISTAWKLFIYQHTHQNLILSS